MSWFDVFAPLRRWMATPLIIPSRCYPFRELPDGRRCFISCKHASENKERSGKVYKGERTRRHDGVDWMVDAAEGDPWRYKRFYCPKRCVAVAAGEVTHIQLVPDNNNGARIWLDIGTGDRFWYMHLDKREILVDRGDVVEMGQELAGMAPRKLVHPRHLHLELTVVGKYRPRNPRPWFDSAVYLPPLVTVPLIG